MKLEKIRLKNFRQFYGDQTLVIASPGPANVTLVHAENGIGKTTLLNAVLWALYEETSKKFEQKNKILNFEAEAEGEATATVELVFEHEGKRYQAMRTQTVTNGGYTKSAFEVSNIEPNGVLSPPLLNPESFINTVIPWPMAPNFFFDGEQAESFAAEKDGDKSVANAIRDILGCTLLETSIKDLEYVERSFIRELGDIVGEDRIRQIKEALDRVDAERDRRMDELEQLNGTIASYEAQISAIESKLREAQAAAAIQGTRDAKQQALDTVRTQALEAEAEIVKWVGVKAIPIAAAKLVNSSLAFIDDQSLKGRIPSPYNEEFVKGLLEAENCICDRPLQPGTAEWRAVQSLLRNAANAELMSKVMRARSRVGMLKELREDAPDLLTLQESRLARLEAQRQDLEREVQELGRKLEGLPVAEIADRERARKKLSADLDAAKGKRINLQRDDEHASQEKRRLSAELSELALQNQVARKIMLRKSAAEQARELLAVVLKNYEVQARTDIERTVNDILAKTARKDYRMEIDESFGLQLLFSDTGKPTPKSGGENQLMSLAFIAALVQFAQQRMSKPQSELLIPATVAPLILDSPFGQLDNRYREDTARFVPEMAPQVVLLVSSSQGKEEVIDALQGKIGAEYILIAENKGPKGERKQDYVTVQGQRKATTLYDCPRTMTRIEKV